MQIAGSAKQGSETSFEPCSARDDGMQKSLAKQSANEVKVCRRFVHSLSKVFLRFMWLPMRVNETW